MKFNEKQLNLLRLIAPEIDFSEPLSDETVFDLDDKVSDYFALHGLADDNQLNDIGVICEEIIDVLSE